MHIDLQHKRENETVCINVLFLARAFIEIHTLLPKLQLFIPWASALRVEISPA